MITHTTRIPVTIVTGFLGSGKTTLLNHVLNGAHGKRIAVIENEFGEVSIDDALLVESNQTIFKMSNGCLCCTINGDLVRTLTELIARRSEFDYVIIETTGVANPAPVVQTFMVNEDIAEAFALDAVVTTIDAKHIGEHIENKECKEQVAFADILILNKLDLVTTDEAEAVVTKLRSLNGLAVIHRTERSNIALAAILDQHAFSSEAVGEDHDEHGHDHEGCGHDHHGETCDHDHGHLHSHHHDDDVQSVGCVLSGDIDKARFNTWFGQLIQNNGDRLYRCKGILSIAGETNKAILQTVHRVVEVTSGSAWKEGERLSKIVFIGKDLKRDELLAGFKGCAV
jgi:G3E family GTPase